MAGSSELDKTGADPAVTGADDAMENNKKDNNLPPQGKGEDASARKGAEPGSGGAAPTKGEASAGSLGANGSASQTEHPGPVGNLFAPGEGNPDAAVNPVTGNTLAAPTADLPGKDTIYAPTDASSAAYGIPGDTGLPSYSGDWATQGSGAASFPGGRPGNDPQPFDFEENARNKEYLDALREELGFKIDYTSMDGNSPYAEFVNTASQAGYGTPEGDYTYAQSLVYKSYVDSGMSPMDAYEKSQESMLDMLGNGHTYESIAGSYAPHSALAEAQVDWLKKMGTRAQAPENGGDGNRDTFSMGQLYGQAVGTGPDTGQAAAAIASRLNGGAGAHVVSGGAGAHGMSGGTVPFAHSMQPPQRAASLRLKSRSMEKGPDDGLDGSILADAMDGTWGIDVLNPDGGEPDDGSGGLAGGSPAPIPDSGGAGTVPPPARPQRGGVCPRNLYSANGDVIYSMGSSISRLGRMGTFTTARLSMQLFYQGAGESGQALRTTQDGLVLVWETAGKSIANTAIKALNTPLQFKVRRLLDKGGNVGGILCRLNVITGGKTVFYTDLNTYKKDLAKAMKKLGMKGISPNLTGRALGRAATMQIWVIRAMIRKYGKTQALMDALAIAQEYRRIADLTVFAEKPKNFRFSHRFIRISLLGIRMMTKDNEAMRGVSTVSRYLSAAVQGAKAFLFMTMSVAKFGTAAVFTAVNAVGWAAGKAGKALSKVPIKAVSTAGKVLTKVGKGTKVANAGRKKAQQAAGRFGRRIHDFIHDPFGIKRKIKSKVKRGVDHFMMKTWNAITARLPFLKPVGKLFTGISRLASFIAEMFGWLVKLLWFLIGFAILIVILSFIVQALVSAIVGLFSFNTYSSSIQSFIVQQINDCYEEDMEKMLALAGNYTTATIDYDDTYRDATTYEEKKNENDSDAFSQSTNCAEIIAMTLVRYGYEPDDALGNGDVDASKREIKNYIKGLYYGSHEIYLDVTTTTYQVDTGRTDSNGNPIYTTKTRTDAEITYRTYYFDYLFNDAYVTSGRTETPVINTNGGGAYGYVFDVDSMYAFFREAGLSHAGACGILGNIKAEDDSFDPTLLASNGAYGLCQWMGSGITDLKNYCLDNGFDYTTITGQCNFIMYELKTKSSYSKLYSLLSGTTYANDAKACASFFCHGYERCVGGSTPYEYWDVYSIYSTSSPYYGTKYQALNKRINYAKNYLSTYASYSTDWSDLIGGGNALVSYALQYAGKLHYTQAGAASSAVNNVGTRYAGADLDKAVYKGGTPTIGVDCSSFVYSIHKHFGITVPSYTAAYGSSHQVSFDDIQPGDILWRNGHVGMYIGNGQLIESKSCYVNRYGNHSHDTVVSTYDRSKWTRVYRYWESGAVRTSAVASSGPYLYSVSHADSGYSGTTDTLTDSQKLKVLRSAIGEHSPSASGSYATYVLHFQYVADLVHHGRVSARTFDSIGSYWLKSASRQTVTLSEFETNSQYRDVIDAYNYVFGNGGRGIQHVLGAYWDYGESIAGYDDLAKNMRLSGQDPTKPHTLIVTYPNKGTDIFENVSYSQLSTIKSRFKENGWVCFYFEQ